MNINVLSARVAFFGALFSPDETRDNRVQSKKGRMQPGDRLGSFEIIALIGAGGMGEVYEARDLRLDRRVALKTLNDKLSADPEATAQFEWEARAVAALSHPNIVAIHEFNRDSGIAYIVTELLEGQSLRKAIGRRPMPWRKVADIGIALCDGLAAAHAKGAVHRDLKPENVFITADGVVKILDFGLAVPLAGANVTTDAITEASPRIAGTAGYIAPEQLRGESADARSDLFALGCVLYEMLTGAAPFARPTYIETVTATLHDEPAPLVARGGKAPAALLAAIDRCLEKGKEQRFQTARDLRFALQSAVDATTRVDIDKRVGRRALAALGTIIVATGIAGFAIRHGSFVPQQGHRPVSLVVLPFDNLSHDESQEYFSAGMTDALISDLAQIRSVRVISRTTSMQYKSAKKTIPEIARQLSVESVVEGSVLRSGNRVRITAQLIDAASDRHVWSGSYEEDLSDVLSLQKHLARDITAEIRAQLTPDEKETLSRAAHVDPTAYDFYLRGMDEYRTMGYDAAAHYFLQSIEIDPNFPLSHARLARAFAAMRFFGEPNAQQWANAALAAAQRALSLDDNAAQSHVALAEVRATFYGDLETYRREVERGLSLSPNDAEVCGIYGDYLTFTGDDRRALAEYKMAAVLDPQTARRFNQWASACSAIGDYDCAIRQARHAMLLPEVFFDRDVSRSIIGRALAHVGSFDEALAVINTVKKDVRREIDLVLLYTLAGKPADAQRYVASIDARSDAEDKMKVHAIIGDSEGVIRELQNVRDVPTITLLAIFSHPEFSAVRHDPRVRELYKRAGLPLP